MENKSFEEWRIIKESQFNNNNEKGSMSFGRYAKNIKASSPLDQLITDDDWDDIKEIFT